MSLRVCSGPTVCKYDGCQSHTSVTRPFEISLPAFDYVQFRKKLFRKARLAFSRWDPNWLLWVDKFCCSPQAVSPGVCLGHSSHFRNTHDIVFGLTIGNMAIRRLGHFASPHRDLKIPADTACFPPIRTLVHGPLSKSRIQVDRKRG